MKKTLNNLERCEGPSGLVILQQIPFHASGCPALNVSGAAKRSWGLGRGTVVHLILCF